MDYQLCVDIIKAIKSSDFKEDYQLDLIFRITQVFLSQPFIQRGECEHKYGGYAYKCIKCGEKR